MSKQTAELQGGDEVALQRQTHEVFAVKLDQYEIFRGAIFVLELPATKMFVSLPHSTRFTTINVDLSKAVKESITVSITPETENNLCFKCLQWRRNSPVTQRERKFLDLSLYLDPHQKLMGSILG